MGTTLELENSSQFNAEITYTNGSVYTIPISYIKKIELLDAKPSGASFAPFSGTDYLIVTLYGVKGSPGFLSTLEHIKKLLNGTLISISWFVQLAAAKPNLYKSKTTIDPLTFIKFKQPILDFENPGFTEYKLYFSYTNGDIS